MTRTELGERQQAFHRANQARAIYIPISGAIGVLVVNLFRGIDVDRWGTWLEVAAFAALVAALAAATIFVPRRRERQIQKAGLTCPSCGEALIAETGRIAVVTGRCGACGHLVAEPD